LGGGKLKKEVDKGHRKVKRQIGPQSDHIGVKQENFRGREGREKKGRKIQRKKWPGLEIKKKLEVVGNIYSIKEGKIIATRK